jgi:hypothetical protein
LFDFADSSVMASTATLLRVFLLVLVAPAFAARAPAASKSAHRSTLTAPHLLRAAALSDNVPCRNGTEYDALERFYWSTGGLYWLNSSNWLDRAADLNAWYGVNCEAGTVYGVFLRGNNLTGSAPPLSGLTTFRELELSANHLTRIDLSGLFQLLILNAERNAQLEIPLFPFLPRLTLLALSDTQYVRLLPDPGSLMPLLRYLHLGSCRGVDLPASLAGLAELQRLDLTNCRLHGTLPSLPLSLTQLLCSNNKLTDLGDLSTRHNLAELHASHNLLKRVSLPVSIYSLSLDYNSLTNFPSLVGMTSLATIDVSWNRISGPLPAFLTCLQMVAVQASHNNITHVDPWWQQRGFTYLPLQVLDLSFNPQFRVAPGEYWFPVASLINLDLSNIPGLTEFPNSQYFSEEGIGMTALQVLAWPVCGLRLMFVLVR